MLRSKQKGLSPIGVLMGVCVFAAFVTALLKIFPYYIADNTVKGIFQEVANEEGVRNKSIQEIKGKISKQFQMNSVSEFDLNKDAFIGEENDLLIIEYSYEIREHIFANIDVVLSFEFSAEVE